MRPGSSSEVGYSQVSRQQNVPKATRKMVREDQLQTDSDERQHSNSNNTRKLAASSPKLRNMEYTNHQYMSQDLSVFAEEIGNVNTKFEEIESLFNITQKLVVEYFEEILNVKGLEYSSLSWAR